MELVIAATIFPIPCKCVALYSRIYRLHAPLAAAANYSTESLSGAELDEVDLCHHSFTLVTFHGRKHGIRGANLAPCQFWGPVASGWALLHSISSL